MVVKTTKMSGYRIEVCDIKWNHSANGVDEAGGEQDRIKKTWARRGRTMLRHKVKEVSFPHVFPARIYTQR